MKYGSIILFHPISLLFNYISFYYKISFTVYSPHTHMCPNAVVLIKYISNMYLRAYPCNRIKSFYGHLIILHSGKKSKKLLQNILQISRNCSSVIKLEIPTNNFVVNYFSISSYCARNALLSPLVPHNLKLKCRWKEELLIFSLLLFQT